METNFLISDCYLFCLAFASRFRYSHRLTFFLLLWSFFQKLLRHFRSVSSSVRRLIVAEFGLHTGLRFFRLSNQRFVHSFRLRFIRNGGIIVFVPCSSCSRKPIPALTPAYAFFANRVLLVHNSATSLLLCCPACLGFRQANTGNTGLRFFRLSNQRFVHSFRLRFIRNGGIIVFVLSSPTHRRRIRTTHRLTLFMLLDAFHCKRLLSVEMIYVYIFEYLKYLHAPKVLVLHANLLRFLLNVLQSYV